MNRYSLIVALALVSSAAVAASAVNGSIVVKAGQQAEDASSVNGAINIEDHAAVANAHTVNGHVALGAAASAHSLHSVNGALSVGADGHVSGDVETVNGAVTLSEAADVEGRVANVNGSIELHAAHVGRGIATTSGAIDIGSDSRVEGGILVRKSCGGMLTWFFMFRCEPTRVVIGPRAAVTGTLKFEHAVKLYVSDSAHIGPVEGASPITYSGERPDGIPPAFVAAAAAAEPSQQPGPTEDHRGARIPNEAQITSVGHDAILASGAHAGKVVAVFGSAISEGDVSDQVVSVFGETRVSGHAGGEAVAVFGDNVINGKVDGQAVAVFGDLELGPLADVGGDVVVVGGTLRRDPGAVIHGGVRQVLGSSFAGGAHRLGRWVRECLLYGRMLAFNADLGWAWGVALGFLLLYVLLALLFREPFERCVQTLDARPGHSILAGLLTVLITPILFVLLVVTVVGGLAVPLVGIGLMCACLFGKAVVLGWIGHRCMGASSATASTRPTLTHPAVAVLIGGAIVLVLYLVPIVSIIVYNLLRVLALGVVVYTLILSLQRGAAPRASRAAPLPAAAAATGGGAPGPSVDSTSGDSAAADGSSAAGSAAPSPVPSSAPVNLARAGFWIRMGALFIDVILVSVVWHLLTAHLAFGLYPDRHSGGAPLLVLALYGAILWKHKGATVGGLVCGLKVIHADGRNMDWTTAIVRALSCFLSLAVAGLGFFWIAFDGEHQAWHDKIAGTLVVRVPKGQPAGR
jgi:uncharacterized RDD family membrane protein YckC